MSGIVFGVCVVAMLMAAAVMQVAVIRDRYIFVSEGATSSRWIIASGLMGLAFRFTYLVIDGHFSVPWHSLASIGLIAFGLVCLELPRFVPQAFMDTQPSEPIPLDHFHTKEQS